VISEPSEEPDAYYYSGGLVFATAEDMPSAITHYLAPEHLQQRERIARVGQALFQRRSMSGIVAAAVSQLYTYRGCL
jgi:hypothetical protein